MIEHLTRLVACDSRNPPRAMAASGALFSYLRAQLEGAGFQCILEDYGEGCVSLLARRGVPDLLLNCHVDTVPATAEWQSDPLRLQVRDQTAVGLGACDTKGAAACLLAAAEVTRGAAALLFTSDEEAGEGRCVRYFLERGERYAGVLVAEPTNCRAVLAHRGLATAIGEFRGVAGHASAVRALTDSALHRAVRWAARALEWAEAEQSRTIGGLAGIRFNLGVVSGGTKSNMIADRAELRFGVRSRPGEDPVALLEQIQSLTHAECSWQLGFVGPSLPAPGRPSATALAERCGLPIAPPVDFWSEAALFAMAGMPALVYGPGSIAQAHAAEEWVALEELERAFATYQRLMS